jgi:hypothetical protein
MSRQTARFLLPYPEGADTPDVPRDMRLLAEAVDTALNGRAAASHTHALPDHRHDSTYSPIVHSHPLPAHKHIWYVGLRKQMSFDNSGSYQWVHGLGKSPDSVHVTQYAPGSVLYFRVGNVSSTVAVITAHVAVVGDKGNGLTMTPYKSSVECFLSAFAGPTAGTPGN